MYEGLISINTGREAGMSLCREIEDALSEYGSNRGFNGVSIGCEFLLWYLFLADSL